MNGVIPVLRGKVPRAHKDMSLRFHGTKRTKKDGSQPLENGVVRKLMDGEVGGISALFQNPVLLYKERRE